MDKGTFSRLVKEFRFKELFNKMGWDNAYGSFEILLNDQQYTVTAICEKSGFRFLQCTPSQGKTIPEKSMRMRIQSKVKRRYYEHLLIFTDEYQKQQIWQYAYKPAGKPLKTIITDYDLNKDPALLYQRSKNLVFTIDEHDDITLVDVTKRMNEALDQNAEAVTKKFYDGFKKQHSKFLSFMKGISEELEKNWYASVMLNRLMFCYFIQKRGFLDNNLYYLKDKLQENRNNNGKDQFYTFYRGFLLQLFHEVLGSPNRDQMTEKYGKIPYLNGGIFAVHELETKYEGQIQIADAAFESLFDFFDQYNWHLDTKITATGRDINPDVIGYIFEKYINDRAQMGAYYTKEDITDYIGKNTIIPFLFDYVQKNHPDPFKPDGEIWQLLKDSDDEYIYQAVKHGIKPDDIWQDLPDEIRAGMDPDQENLVELRRSWNSPTPEDIALPTEIWRETIARRQRYQDIKNKIKQGEMQNINDLITYNLDIRQFTLDLIANTQDPKLVFQFYKALKSVSILDPTCGSGAFLFAAMNILEDLYEICIERMKDFVDDSNGHNYGHMKKELDKMDNSSHPNLPYFIYKSIILNNLYGVDIMNEAVEIAKLRLFLKLVACVEPKDEHKNYGLEPLPDIDFNIRCGNTLVGYANWDEIIADIESDVITAAENKEIIPQMCQKVALAFKRYKEMQLEGCENFENFLKAKTYLLENLKILTSQLDLMLHLQSSSKSLEEWKKSHQPFHWYAEFYEIIHENGGFDVIIGNPPYVEYNKKKFIYSLQGYQTEKCGNLYAYIYEKSIMLLSKNGRISLIVPSSAVCTVRMNNLKEIILNNSLSWLSFYGNRPSTLFSGAQQNLTIIISQRNRSSNRNWSTKHIRWSVKERDELFCSISYVEQDKSQIYTRYGDIIHKNTLNRLSSFKIKINGLRYSHYPVYYSNSAGYWLHASTYLKNPEISRDKVYYVGSDKEQILLCAILNSCLFYLVFSSISDLYHVTLKEITYVTIPTDYDINNLRAILSQLESSLYQNMQVIEKNEKTGLCKQEEFYPKFSKDIIDNIDDELFNIYHFDNVSLDYTINFDIKYRMGSKLNE